MTYKKIQHIKSIILILFILQIFLQNFTIILPTRNLPFFSIKVQKKEQYSQYKSKSKKIAKLALLNVKNYILKQALLGENTQVVDYNRHIQTKSISRQFDQMIKVYEYLKGLLTTTKILLFELGFSLKYRFNYLIKLALIMREKALWLLEGNFFTREATLGKAFVFADLSGAPETIYHSFKVIGILHLIAASSANIYLILAFAKPLTLIVRYYWGQRASAVLDSCIIIVYFILINGHFNLVDSSPSILRASLSCLLAILANFYLNLAVKRLHLLVVVCILCLVINPFYLQSLGFQLSFLASFIIIFFWPFIKRKIAKSSLMLSLTVQFFLWPLLLFYFSSINLIAIPANVILSPLVEFLTTAYFTFIFFGVWRFTIVTDFIRNLIYFVNNIFFTILTYLEKMPAKSLELNHNKYSAIIILLLISLAIVSLIFREKNQAYKKYKYRTLCKWPNWPMGS